MTVEQYTIKREARIAEHVGVVASYDLERCGITQFTPANEARRKPVRCMDTGKVYESFKAAEAACGLTNGAIGRAIKTSTRAAGLRWELANSASPTGGPQ